jgi:MinD-like ATPase involved in chromosome partitioning or flagellar assembly
MSRIVTFYSYKGGVGRSMALANVAVLLARRKLRVLIVDWDLEAPGIEHYFSYFKSGIEKPGLLTLLIDAGARGDVDYRDYISTISGDGFTLSLLASGRTADNNYSANLERFDWHIFFAKGGGDFLEATRERWLRDFDVVLVDSRTGLSDSGGICTIQLPDILVGMFTANHQSLYGVRDVIRLAQRARQSLAYDRSQLSIIPLGSRFANDFRESKSWLDRTAEAMSEFYTDWLPAWANVREVTDQLKIPHVDYFSYGEKLAVVEQGTSDPQGMGFVYDKVSNLLASNLENAEEVFRLKVETEATSVSPRKMQLSKDARDSGYDVYISYRHDSYIDERVRSFIGQLERAATAVAGKPVRFFLDYREIEIGSEWADQTATALAKSKLLLAFVTPAYWKSSWTVAEWKTFQQREIRTGQRLIFPLLAFGEELPVPETFRGFVDLRKFMHPIKPVQDDREVIDIIESLARDIVKALYTAADFDVRIVSPGEIKIDTPRPRISNSLFQP